MAAPPVPTRVVAQPTSSRPAPNRGAPNPLLNPNQSLSGQALLNAAQQLANVQINPAITDLSKQIATNNAQTQGTINLTGGYYNQLEPFVQKGVDQSGQIAQGLNTTLQGIGDQTQSQLQGLGQGALSSLAKYVPQGDGGIANSATADLAAQIAKQQGLAAQQSQTARNYGATQGANYQQLNNSQLGTYGLQGQEALRNIAQSGTVRNEPLMAKIAGLQQQRGALVATDLGKLRQQQVGNNVALGALGLKSAALQNTAAYDRAKINATLRGQDVTMRGQSLANNARLASIAQSNLNNLRTTNTSAANNAANNSTRMLIAQMKQQAAAHKVATGPQANAIFSHVDYITGELQNLINHGVSPKDAYHLIQNGGRIQTGTTASGRATYRTYYPNKLGTEALNAAYNVRSGGSGLSPGDLAWFASLGIRNPTRYAHAPSRALPPGYRNTAPDKPTG